MLQAGLCLLAGMYALQLSSFALLPDHNAVTVVAAALLLLWGRTRAVGWALAGAALFGAAVFEVRADRLSPDLAGDSMVVSVRVADFPRGNGRSTSFLAHSVGDPRAPARLRLTWFDPPVQLRAGDSWQLEVRLRRPRGAMNEGGRDAEAWFTRERIGGVGYVVAGPRNHLLYRAGEQGIATLRHGIVERIEALPLAPGAAAVLAAIVAGARHAMTDTQWQNFAATGTSHLMAISGLHVGLAGTAGYFLARLVGGLAGTRLGQHRASLWAAFCIALVYAVVSGFAIPARRASLMLALGVCAWSAQRELPVARVLVTSAVLIALVSPLATMAPGFQLSFAAVGLLLWQGRQRSTFRPTPAWHSRRVWCRARQLALLQLALLVGLAPVVIAWFGRLSLAAPLVNFVAVPVFSLWVVPMALAGAVLGGPFQALGDRLLQVSALGVGCVEQLVSVVAAADWAVLPVATAGTAAWGVILLLLYRIVVPPGWPGRQLVWPCLVALATGSPRAPDPGCYTAHVLDVGQGLAAVIETRRHVLVYDTGAAYFSGGSAAQTTLLPFLQRRGIRRVDRLVVSHADLDHAGGVSALLDAVSIDMVLGGEPLDIAGQRQMACRAGDSWGYDGISFRVLHPPAAGEWAGNDASCVIEVAAGTNRVLLTGDIERAAEALLVETGRLRRVAAVLVPHHGSSTSSTPEFIDALRADWAIVSAGFANRWGLPRAEIVERWRGAGATVLDTGTSGQVSLQLCALDRAPQISEHRRTRRRIWHE